MTHSRTANQKPAHNDMYFTQVFTHLSTHLSISLRKQHSLCKMPLTLKQLQNRRDQCLERIEEHEK